MSDPVKTVIQLCPRLNSGGIERGTVDLALALKEAGFNSIVISGGGYLETELVAHGVQHIKIPIYSKNPLVFLINLIRLSKTLAGLKADIIHPRSRIPTWLIYFLRNKLNTHFVTSCNGIHSLDKLGLKKIYNSVLVKGEEVVANSEFTKKYLVNNYKVSPDKIRVIHRGIDTEKFNPNSVSLDKIEEFRNKFSIQNSRFNILLAARLAYWKGQHVFIEACHLLKDKFKLDFVALIVGDSKNKSYKAELAALIKQYSLSDNVKILGESQDMSTLYALSDVVVSTSIKPEAFGRSIVEAQAMAKLVIATNHGGACETIIAGETGWLCAPGDAAELAQELFHIFKLPDAEKAQIARNASQKMAFKFSKKHMCDEYIKLYRNLL